MKDWFRRWGWTVCKWLLAAAILTFIGRQFYLNLASLDFAELTLRPGWLVLSAALYLLGLGACAWYWHHLLRVFGQRPRASAIIKGYYIGHLGKYVPGKAWALLMRGGYVRGPGVRLGVAILTSFYEVLTTMAAGALLAAVLFTAWAPAATGLTFHPVWLGLGLLALVGVPLLPAVFNRLVARAARRFQGVESFRLPPLRMATLAVGLAAAAGAWSLLGVSLWAAVNAVVPEPLPLTPERWATYTAMTGLSYVLGFLAFMLPSGVGVREGVLEGLLAPQLAADVHQASGVATVVVIALRLLWTAAELVVAAAVWWLPGGAAGGVVGAAPGLENGIREAAPTSERGASAP